jgi:L-asparagine transporter-like permease
MTDLEKKEQALLASHINTEIKLHNLIMVMYAIVFLVCVLVAISTLNNTLLLAISSLLAISCVIIIYVYAEKKRLIVEKYIRTKE